MCWKPVGKDQQKDDNPKRMAFLITKKEKSKYLNVHKLNILYHEFHLNNCFVLKKINWDVKRMNENKHILLILKMCESFYHF